ncbi:MAG: tRNA-intron lyase [Candidatus Diapherotrites archaeon]|nr:tRNA-intron lyase [Candidatus Diapherotrites archaeon]
MALLTEGRIWVTDEKVIQELLERGFGEDHGGKVLLSPEETLFLKEKRKNFVIEDPKGKKLEFKDLMKLFTKKDKVFPLKYIVYRDIRARGFIVKTGFKFGTHYRIYGRGVRPGEGHAIWLVHAVPEEYKCDFQDFSRSVRLAQNVRKKMIYALVDKEGDITYYKIERFRP